MRHTHVFVSPFYQTNERTILLFSKIFVEFSEARSPKLESNMYSREKLAVGINIYSCLLLKTMFGKIDPLHLYRVSWDAVMHLLPFMILPSDAY